MDIRSGFITILSFTLCASCTPHEPNAGIREGDVFQPLTYAEASAKADAVLKQMTLEEKISLVGGDRGFFIRPIPRVGLREVYMSDATQGVHLRDAERDGALKTYQLQKSTAFPCPISLASTWDPDLAYRYAESVGEECRAGGIGILLGPGMNEYRHSQCGRNFEYFGEDPYLRSRIIEKYVEGVQSTGTVATLKHFVANNTEYYRRRSNSIIDERALHEIYLPPFKAGIDAGAKAVMTAYNQLNGEWCGQSSYVIDTLLKKDLGFQWLVMTDWSSVYDGEKVAKSGQDLEMPRAVALKDVQNLIAEGKVQMEDIDRMAGSILRTYFVMKLGERQKDPSYESRFGDHEQVALQTAREGIVLLKNEGNILPVGPGVSKILLAGDYVDKPAAGGGSAAVRGYDVRLMIDELKTEFGDRLTFVKNPTIDQIKGADLVFCNVGTNDTEGSDRPFALPNDQEEMVKECVANNPHTVVIVTSGSGVRMTDWSDNAKAIVYAWYGGQIGNKALAEILAGKTNPSGKLPITIEREFSDSPGYGYIPAGESLSSEGGNRKESDHPVYDIPYNEGIFVGYRWYEHKNLKPLFPFGHGLSYTSFAYTDLKVSSERFTDEDTVTISFEVKNRGSARGCETAQLYVQDVESSVPRPVKELKGFQRVDLSPGESRVVSLKLSAKDFSFWSPGKKGWITEKGVFVLHIGSSSADIRLKKEIRMM
jgi:beta-glucosidase